MTTKENKEVKDVKYIMGCCPKRKIELLEKANIPEGTKVLVTVLPDDNESQFWLKTSQISLDAIWNNSEDDVYAELLKEGIRWSAVLYFTQNMPVKSGIL